MKFIIFLVLGFAAFSLAEATGCEAVFCAPGTVCVMQTVQCIQAPCNAVPVCVAPPSTVADNPCLLERCPPGFECRLQACKPQSLRGCTLSAVCKPRSTDLNPCRIGKPVLDASGREWFCGWGPHSLTCPQGSSCNVHPADAYAVCCLDSPSNPAPPPLLPGPVPDPISRVGYDPCIAATCLRGTECRVQACTPGAFDGCSITATCRTRSTAPNPCPSGKPVLSATSGREMFCGLAPNSEQCPVGTFCNIHPADLYAVCCLNTGPHLINGPPPINVPPLVSKPGTCPRAPGVGICITQCFGDSSCPGSQKCCSNGCGQTCVAPAVSTQVQKPGRCGRPFWPCSRRRRCEGDGDCPGTGKCCRSNCGKVCTRHTFLPWGSG